MTSFKRLTGIFLVVFLVVLGIEYAPDGIKAALSTAAAVVFLLWFFGYVDLRKLLGDAVNGKEKKEA